MSDQERQTTINVPSDEQLTCPRCLIVRQDMVRNLLKFGRRKHGRRKFVEGIEQYFACSIKNEFRFVDTDKHYHPEFCWPDVSARNVSYFLKRKVCPTQSKPVDIRKLDQQRQMECYLRATIARYSLLTQTLGREHKHPGWERL